MNSLSEPSPAPLRQPPTGIPLPADRPGVIRVLGILDLIFASLNALLVLIAILTVIYSPPGSRTYSSVIPEVITTIITIVTWILMLIAGLKLMKNRRDAIRASNRYAIVSLGGKIVVIAFMIASIASSSEPPFQNVPGLYEIIYPILCLVLLNRPRVKGWLAANGT